MPHRTVVRENEGTVLPARKEDLSFWVKTATFLDKYKLLTWLIWAIVIALGFNLSTPAQVAKHLQSEIDTIKTQMNKASEDRQTLETKLDVLLRNACYNKGTTSAEKYLSGLKCD